MELLRGVYADRQKNVYERSLYVIQAASVRLIVVVLVRHLINLKRVFTTATNHYSVNEEPNSYPHWTETAYM